MFEFARYEARHRVRGTLALTVGLSALTTLYIWMFPSVVASGVDLDAYVEAFPPALVEAFGIRSLGTIEGFLAAELYAFGWVLLLGLYLGYSAASLLAEDVERGRMDITLSMPVRRWRVVVENYLSLLLPVAVLNLVLPVVVYVGAVLIDESIPVRDLLAVHALSVPYLLSCASVGLLASAVADRAGVAQRVALAVLGGLFLVESVVAATDYAWVGNLAPMRHYDPTAVLVDGVYDLEGAAILLGGTVLLVGASVLYFSRRDI
jgi:ABC-2 type transport system permease protein